MITNSNQNWLPQRPSSRKVRSATVRKLLLTKTGRYNDMYLRPYSPEVNSSTIDNLINTISKVNLNDKISRNILSPVTPNIFRPQSQPGQQVQIPNGFNEYRLRFVLQIEIGFTVGSNIIYWLQGYTDYYGVNEATGHLDPNLLFIINSITSVSTVSTVGANGASLNYVPGDKLQVIDSNKGNLNFSWNSMPSYTMRPTDIVHGMQENIYSEYEDIPVMHASIEKFQPVVSKRSNGNPNAYLTDLINAYQTTKVIADFNDSSADLLQGTANALIENNLDSNPFIMMLMNYKGTAHANSYFIFQDLASMCPDVLDDNITTISLPNRHQAQLLAQADRFTPWEGSDWHTVWSSLLAQIVPGLMSDCSLSMVKFYASNQTYDGKHAVAIIPNDPTYNVIWNRSLIDADNLELNLFKFSHLLETETLNTISFNGEVGYVIEMTVNLFGDTTITISFDGKQPDTFSYPTFCDASLSPVIAQNRNEFLTVTNDISNMLDHISNEQNSRATYQNTMRVNYLNSINQAPMKSDNFFNI